MARRRMSQAFVAQGELVLELHRARLAADRAFRGGLTRWQSFSLEEERGLIWPVHRKELVIASEVRSVGDLLKLAGFEVPGAPRFPRPNRYEGKYGRLRRDVLHRCVLCGDLCWEESREEHIWFAHKQDARGRVDSFFLATPCGDDDELDEDELPTDEWGDE